MAQVFDLLYGTTLRGKSKAIVELVKVLTKQSGKKARLFIGDGGLATYENAGLVEARLLDVVEYDAYDFPQTVLDRMVKGWMPQPVEGANKGKWASVKNEDYILTIFEGASVLGKYLLGHTKGGYAYRAGQGELIGNKNDDAVVKVKDESMPWMGGDGVSMGGNTMSHYRMVQPILLNAIKVSKRLPGWVIWTAHPTETVDKSEGGKTGDFGKLLGKTLVGPEIGGKAMADWVSREFGNTLHFDIATKLEAVQDAVSGRNTKVNDREYRIYTRDHYDPDGNFLTEFRAGNRCPLPEMMPDYLASEKEEDAGFALVKFYNLMAEAKKIELAKLKALATV